MEPQPKKRKDSLSDALAGAAGAFAQVVSSKDAHSKSPSVSLQHTELGKEYPCKGCGTTDEKL